MAYSYNDKRVFRCNSTNRGSLGCGREWKAFCGRYRHLKALHGPWMRSRSRELDDLSGGTARANDKECRSRGVEKENGRITDGFRAREGFGGRRPSGSRRALGRGTGTGSGFHGAAGRWCGLAIRTVPMDAFERLVSLGDLAALGEGVAYSVLPPNNPASRWRAAATRRRGFHEQELHHAAAQQGPAGPYALHGLRPLVPPPQDFHRT